MSVLSETSEPRILLRGTAWQTYLALREAPENRQVRMTFHRGELELMSPSRRHERIAELLGRLVTVWTEELGLPVQSCGSMTVQREDLRSGLEPDKCYYLQNEPVVRDREELDLSVDPPPDLVIEVAVTWTSVRRMPFYAALGGPEVWRWRDERLEIYRLEPDGPYVECEGSRALSGFPQEEAERILRARHESDETALVRRFRAFAPRRKEKPGTPAE